MPEYLSPAVYVEEVNTGSKPIEGVSTSTTGMVGVTERGPENVPILVTSTGEFSRIFGGKLDMLTFTNPSTGTHAYLPHSVEGYFTNGGRRAYTVRVLPEQATHASRVLFDRAQPGAADTVLLRGAPRDSGTNVNTPLLYVLDNSNLNNNDFVRLGNGSRAEYRQVASMGNTEAHVSLGFPLGLSKDATPGNVAMNVVVPAADGAFSSFDLALDAPAGATSIRVTEAVAGQALALVGIDLFFEFGTGAIAEYIRGRAVDLGGGNAQITLESPLSLARQAGIDTVTVTDIAVIAGPPFLSMNANGGDLLIYPDDTTPFLPGTFLSIDNVANGGSIEVRRVGQLARLELDLNSYAAYSEKSLVQRITMLADAQDVAVITDQRVFDVVSAANLQQGMRIDVDNAEQGVIQSISGDTLSLTVPLSNALVGGQLVTPVCELVADALAGSVLLSVDNRVGLQVGDVLRLGLAPNEEYVTIMQVVGPQGVAPNSGTLIVSAPLAQDHTAGTFGWHQLAPSVDNTLQPAYTVLAGEQNATALIVNDGTGFVQDDVVRITEPSGAEHYHRLSANAFTGLNPREIELFESIDLSHEYGAPLVEREQLIDVQALDRGGWGNRLLISIQDEQEGLSSGAEIDAFNPPQELNLTTLTGVEAGTILEVVDPLNDQVIGTPLKVRSVDRTANNQVTLDLPGLDLAQTAALNAAQQGGYRLPVRSREFSLTVLLLDRPHPAVPTRSEDVLDSETFRHLSMDGRHSHSFEGVIGTTWIMGSNEDDNGNPLRLADQRSEGESAYIRVRDRAPDSATAESVRLGPEALIDILSSGRPRAARHRLGESAGAVRGSDSINTMSDAMYVGNNSNEPRDRSGIFALNNIQDISLVAVPGQTRVAVQQALIDHCEAARYRFAVLDAYGPDNDSLAEVQFQRQQLDSKYAAIYHPWLTIPEPMPANLSNIRQTAIPNSGHVLGIYARTDNERGVHKAPANTVVRGITGLARSLNKSEHDILNPSPRNINVIRDFREDNRGLRVWGARVITSDSDYKYVNVRRLLNFIESSVEGGLQWAVFEPNQEQLWARVRRSITNFLNVVWRNGALEGERPEQAFFVKCDRTTMTQTDIDNGRLICVVGVAPVKPAEFVIVRIGLWTANTQQ